MYDDDPDDEPTVACPACDAEIYADAEQCPRCGHWQTDEDTSAVRPASRFPRWVSFTSAALLLLIAYLWLTTL